MRRYRAIGLVLLAFCTSLSGVARAADLPTAEAILKIHRENKARLSQLHLQCVHHYETTEAHCRWAQKEADEKERVFKLLRQAKPEEPKIEVEGKPVEGAELKHLIEMLSGATAERDINNLRLQAKPYRSSSPMEFFIRDDEYQFRKPLKHPDGEAELLAWKFPEATLSTKTLLAEYRDVSIYSRSSQDQASRTMVAR